MDEYLGVIKAFGFNFAPRGWALCDGSLLQIAQNQALFALLGTTFGGDGVQTFGLPDLRGRTLIGMGSAPGLQPYQLGQKGGVESVTLIAGQLPAHAHSFALNAYSEPGNVGSPAGASPAATGSLDPEYRTSGTVVPMASQQTGSNGSNQAHENRSPYLAINYSISLQGIFPSRN
ncbi:phage tail protein [Fibrella forsythiae]|uniref:Phage tail protein n=1 Tax=Fibrella forsythiae TaxID=2817061 RepID=A0ABS3JM15_9BACT|nr:tail fiber protein [Fibrella forsythiae]MBO0951055.1 phage tail protein [Fibrella forsythiae]